MFLPKTLRAASDHAIAEYPKESAGIVVDGRYLAMPNIAAEPTRSFAITPEIFPRHGDRLQAIIHSHPDDYPVPSASDMEKQTAVGLPYGIIATAKEPKTGNVVASPATWFGDGVAKQPLIGRGFIHGWQDCFSGIRDWHAAAPRGIIIPEFPRDWEWWLRGDGEKDGDLYRDHFQECGGVQIAAPVAGAIGLVPMGRVGQGAEARPLTVPNHAFVWLGDGTIYHHLTGRLPIDPTRIAGRQPFGVWRRYFNADPIWIRHRDMTDALAQTTPWEAPL